MVSPRAVHCPRRPPLLLATLPLLMLLSQAHADVLRRPYIVQLADQPVAAYTGSISGLRATKAGSGQRLDLGSGAVRQYRDFLSRQQASARQLVAAAPVTRQYQVVFNGFAARLSDAEVRALKASGKIARITADEPLQVVTNYTPTFLGLDQPGGLWEQLGGRAQAGEDLIVGVIDTGIWPENLSFADRIDSTGQPTFDPAATLAYGPPPARWQGLCQTGEGFSADQCNNKLIGARFFDAGFLASGENIHWSEFRSPRDSLYRPAGEGGHGTHTASTAAGNDQVPALASNGDLLGLRSGIAPRARLAMYKICWTFNAGFDSASGMRNSCFTSDSLAAIDAAVNDGVDVLNYSISGGTSPLDPVEQAFRHAAAAGVFVAAAAGNSGPANEVAHISPWLTTVAATTHDKTHAARLTLGNGQTYQGASLNPAALTGVALIRAEDALAPGADPTQAALCYRQEDVIAVHPLPQLDPAKVAGKIVLCQRGSSARTDKAQAVKTAGGVGMVLLDDGHGTVVDLYSVPTVHVSQEDGVAIAAYAAGADAHATLAPSTLVPMNGPSLADFSSRGPNRYDAGILKPDLAAPGVDVLAGVSPSLSQTAHAAVLAAGAPGTSVSAYMSGTSMATPHVAGLGALLKQRHPDWSPAAIKSALMTSARTVQPNALSGAEDGTLPWGQGAGLVVPGSAADPGLVYDADSSDYQRYLCGLTSASADCALGAQPGHALNLASISLPGVIGNQRVRRSVTNVGTTNALYTASVTLPGFTATVTPATLQLAPGETQSYTLDVQRSDAADGLWQLGELVWTDGEHRVRSPLQARYNSGAEAPPLLSDHNVSGNRQLDVRTGFSGTMGATKAGLREYVRLAQRVTQAAHGSLETLQDIVNACVARGAGVKAVTIGIPNQTMIARFTLSNLETAGGADDDLDLALLDQGNNLIALSAHAGSNETVTLHTPPMGVVKICVLGYQLKNGSQTDYTVSYATAIPNDSKGALKLSLPATVSQGGNASVGVSWTGLEQGKRYLGGVQLRNPAGRAVAFTELDIDTRDVIPAATGAARKLRSTVD